MASLGQSFNVNSLPKDEGGEFTPLPEGWYNVVVKDSQLKPTKDGSGQYISIRLTVEGPTHAGRGIFTNLNIINKSPDAERIGRAQLRTVLECGGVQEFSDTDQLIGIRLQVKVAVKPARQDPATGRVYDADNEVKGYKAIEGAAMPAMGCGIPAFQQQPAPAFAAQPPAFQQPAPPYQAPQQAAQPVPAAAPWAAPQGQQPSAPAVSGTPPWAARPAA